MTCAVIRSFGVSTVGINVAVVGIVMVVFDC